MYNNYNPYYQQPIRNYQPMEQPQYAPPVQTQPVQKLGLQGKLVDNIEVVKVTEIPLDGSKSYFPLADDSAIVMKQLQMDGTSKMIVYKPSEDTPSVPKYITQNDLNKAIDAINLPDVKVIKEDIKSLKKQIKGILDGMSENDD